MKSLGFASLRSFKDLGRRVALGGAPPEVAIEEVS
jgi:hypothetical protein